MELTAQEFHDFRRLAQQLVATLNAMADHLMAEEQLTCEVESEHIWLEVEGHPQAMVYASFCKPVDGGRGFGRPLWPAR